MGPLAMNTKDPSDRTQRDGEAELLLATRQHLGFMVELLSLSAERPKFAITTIRFSWPFSRTHARLLRKHGSS